VNHNVVGFVKKFNLTGINPYKDDVGFGLWNGKEFIIRQSEVPVLGSIMNLGSMLWRYGLTLLYMKLTISNMLKSWETLYSFDEPYETVEELFRKMNLYDLVTATAPGYFESKGVSKQFISELLVGMTRVNYNTDAEIMNAFAVAVSAIGSEDDIYTVAEGNRVMCEKLLEASKADVKLNTPVTSIGLGADGKYLVDGTEYDAVVIAVPIELSKFEFPGLDIDPYVFNARTYQEVHVTFAAGTLNSGYFKTTGRAPDHILTVEEPTIPFSSIGKLNGVTTEDGRPVYKMFSKQELEEPLLDELFTNRTTEHKQAFHAYPVLTPQQPVPVKLHNKLFYVNSMESVVSTMETETISAKNIAKLLAKSLGVPLVSGL